MPSLIIRDNLDLQLMASDITHNFTLYATGTRGETLAYNIVLTKPPMPEEPEHE
jgi:hypothetical protein